MNNNEFVAYFDEQLELAYKSKFSDSPSELRDAVKYALFGGGKRVRPTLCFLSGKFLGLSEERILPYALAIEFIHTYSLIHDDLPCMDNDDYRRGKPTVHKKFGESIALLAGDALLNAAYELLFDAVAKNQDYALGAKLIASCAGLNGMIGGQSKEFTIKTPDEDDYTDICLKKTGALIYAAVVAPSYLAFDNEKRTSLSTYAKALGLAFQAADDLLDKDKGEKMSFVTISGEEKAKKILLSATQTADKALSKFENAKELLEYNEKLSQRVY